MLKWFRLPTVCSFVWQVIKWGQAQVSCSPRLGAGTTCFHTVHGSSQQHRLYAWPRAASLCRRHSSLHCVLPSIQIGHWRSSRWSKTSSSSTTQSWRPCWCVPLTCAQSSLSRISRWASVALCCRMLSETLGHFSTRIWTCNIMSNCSARKPASNSETLAGCHLLNAKTAETLVHAYITSCVDCRNALLHGVPEALLQQLQSVQNTVTHTVTTEGKQAHSKDLVQQLHWLPVGFQVDYKILDPPLDLLCLAWSGASVPLSATDWAQTYQDPLLPFPATALPAHEQTKEIWRLSFSHAALHLWNALPSELRTPLTTSRQTWRVTSFRMLFHRLHSETHIDSVWTPIFAQIIYLFVQCLQTKERNGAV